MRKLKQNENKTTIHPKVTHAIQQKISSNINNRTEKEIKKTSEEMPENKKSLFAFFKPLSRLIQKKNCLRCEHTENGLN